MDLRNLQIRIRRPPSRPSDLELVEAPSPSLTNGSFLARALWLALDPFVCASDSEARDGAKPGDLVPAHGVREVVESRHELFGAGTRRVALRPEASRSRGRPGCPPASPRSDPTL